MKIRITEPGWAGYTGFVGAVEFIDGVSVDVTPMEAQRVGSIIRVEGTDQENIVDLANKQMAEAVAAPVENYSAKTTEPAVVAPAEEPVEVADFAMLSRTELEDIADKGGIAALRKIAAPMGVKGTSIAAIIEGILAVNAQLAPVETQNQAAGMLAEGSAE